MKIFCHIFLISFAMQAKVTGGDESSVEEDGTYDSESNSDNFNPFGPRTFDPDPYENNLNSYEILNRIRQANNNNQKQSLHLSNRGEESEYWLPPDEVSQEPDLSNAPQMQNYVDMEPSQSGRWSGTSGKLIKYKLLLPKTEGERSYTCMYICKPQLDSQIANDDHKYYIKLGQIDPKRKVAKLVKVIRKNPKTHPNVFEETGRSPNYYASKIIPLYKFNPQLTVDRPNEPKLYRYKFIRKLSPLPYYYDDNKRKKNYSANNRVVLLVCKLEGKGAAIEASGYEDIPTFSIPNPYTTIATSSENKLTRGISEQETTIATTNDNKLIKGSHEQETTSGFIEAKAPFTTSITNNNEERIKENNCSNNTTNSNEKKLLLKFAQYVDIKLNNWFQKFKELLRSQQNTHNLQNQSYKILQRAEGLLKKTSRILLECLHSQNQSRKSEKEHGTTEKIPTAHVNRSECLNFINQNNAMSKPKDLQMQFLRLWDNQNMSRNNSAPTYFTKAFQPLPNIWLDVSRIFYGNENLTITKALLHKILPFNEKRNGFINNFRYSAFDRSFKSGTGIAYHLTKEDFEDKTHKNINSNVNEPSNRIIGGDQINIEKYPYQVAIFRNEEFICGGAIIDNQFVLTAAHCLESFETKEFYVKAGITHLDDVGQKLNAAKILKHEMFEFNNCDNDIALIKVDKPFEFSSTVGIIKLPDDDLCLKVGDYVIITGYGSTGENMGWINKDFFAITLSLTSREKCVKRRLRTVENVCVTDRQICTDSPADHGTCYGDSGGPMTTNGYIVGVVSWGSPCAIGDPDIFTNVAVFVEWIKHIISKEK